MCKGQNIAGIKMPCVPLDKLPLDESSVYPQCLIEAFDSVKFESDVTIHCQNNTNPNWFPECEIKNAKLYKINK